MKHGTKCGKRKAIWYSLVTSTMRYVSELAVSIGEESKDRQIWQLSE